MNLKARDKRIDIELLVESFKNFFQKKKEEKIEFSFKDMFQIQLNCFFGKPNKNLKEKIYKINHVNNYLDYYKIINILRDSVALKNIILTNDQYNGMKFLNREINFDNEWKFSDNEINNIINFKNRGFSYQKNNFCDINIIQLISEEISVLLENNQSK